MVNKALIVCDRWGPAIHGGVTDALHLVIRLLQNMGISVHCTAVQATEEEEEEADELGVTLELPTKTGSRQFRKPNRDWLLYHNIHYPNLEELANVKFVFGFTAFTSEAAFHITCKVFPKASCYLINLFEKDDITPLVIGCSKEELEFRKRIMSDEFKNAKCSFSVGERIFARYKRLYYDTNQMLLSPMVIEEYLMFQGSDKLQLLERERFQILSVLQEYEFEDFKSLDVVINAVNTAADYIYELQETPPTWKIIGIPPRKAAEIVEKLKRSPRLTIEATNVTLTDELNRELVSSHLVLIPPSITNYGNLTLAAMCATIPVVYPRGSPSHDIVCKHMNILEATDCAIDMDADPTDLTKRITSVKLKNPTALQRAMKIREHIKKKVAKDLQESNEDFIASINADIGHPPCDKNDLNKETASKVELKGKPDDDKTKKQSRQSLFQRVWHRLTKRKRNPGQIEIKVRPDGIIPKSGNSVREVSAAFYSNEHTKENAVLVGKQLDQRRDGMKLHQIGKGSISYIMDCQSSKALESLMSDYSSGSLHRMVKSTFMSDRLLDEIGALYLSLGTSIDHAEYLLCRKELVDIEGEDIYRLRQLPIEAIKEMNQKIESNIPGEKASVNIAQAMTRQKARDRGMLRGMSVEEERLRISELKGLMNEWIKTKKDLQQMNTTHSELVFDRQEFIQKTGAIINEVESSLEIKQELMLAFQKFLPVGPDKTGKPAKKLVIDGNLLLEYVESTVHDFDIPTEGKRDTIKRFSKLVQAKSGEMNVKASLTAKKEISQERIQAIVDDADIPDEQKEVYQQWRQVQRGKPPTNTIRILLSRDGKKSSGDVFRPLGLTINQNGHVVVCENGHDDQPGSVKTVSADTAQILTSVTVHDLPRTFKPYDTKMADNGDYYTADDGNKCIVVSDEQSTVKQLILMGKLKDPSGILVDKDRNVFIADYGADCVFKCNGDGDIVSSQKLSEPWSLTMNSDYQLIVSCRGDEKCVCVFDSNLKRLAKFGSDHLEDPRGVTVDNADNIYVADWGNIVKFDRKGEYKETVTIDGYPNYIAALTDGGIVYSEDDGSVCVMYT